MESCPPPSVAADADATADADDVLLELPACFDSSNFDINEYLYDATPLDDLFDTDLTRAEMAELLTPSTESWSDVPATSFKTKITIDDAKSTQWAEAKKEIKHVQNRCKELIDEKKTKDGDAESIGPLTTEDVILFILGPSSAIGNVLQEHLELPPEQYVKFMITFCAQCAYKVSSTQLFHPLSLLDHKDIISKEEYNAIWMKLATKKKLKKSEFHGSGRRDKYIWEYLEETVNNLCHSISIVNRRGRISIALDDDKIWVDLSGESRADTFGIKYTTHVQPNRKGINAHTAVSTTTNMPLGICIERKNDSATECFKRLLTTLFSRHGAVDLHNCVVASDRGYMLPKLVFDFLIANGSNIVGTVKRSLDCWPFTFEQKLKDNDKRKKIETNGPPTLFVKNVSNSAKKVFAIAFRNGTDRVSTAVSSLHKNHHWEGIALNQQERLEYEDNASEDISCFYNKSIQRIDSLKINKDELADEKDLIKDLLRDTITPLTLIQGKK